MDSAYFLDIFITMLGSSSWSQEALSHSRVCFLDRYAPIEKPATAANLYLSVYPQPSVWQAQDLARAQLNPFSSACLVSSAISPGQVDFVLCKSGKADFPLCLLRTGFISPARLQTSLRGGTEEDGCAPYPQAWILPRGRRSMNACLIEL